MNNQKGIAPIAIILIIIGVLVLGGGVWYYGEIKKTSDTANQNWDFGLPGKKTEESLTPSPTPSPSVPPVAEDETKDWKIYRDEKYGYQISYPKEYEYKDLTKNAVESYKKSQRAFPLPEASFIVFGTDVKDDYLTNPNNRGENHKLEINVYDGYIGVEDFFGSGNFNYKIEDLKAIRGETFEDSEHKFKRLVILFWKDNLTFLIKIPSGAYMNDLEMKTIDKMLLSMKFFDREQLKLWEFYKNEKYGFELRYPRDKIFLTYRDIDKNNFYDKDIEFEVELSTTPPNDPRYASSIGLMTRMIIWVAGSTENFQNRIEKIKSELSHLGFYEIRMFLNNTEAIRTNPVNIYAGQETTLIFIKGDRYLYEISYPTKYGTYFLFDQILSTFRFID